MINTYRHKDVVWVDMIETTVAEVQEVALRYGINPMVAEELLTPTLKPKVDLYPEYIYLILHFPAFHHSHNENQNQQEVDFIIGHKFLITAHYDTIDPIHKFAKVFEVSSILDRNDIGEHAGHIFYHMIRKLYKSLTHELDYITDKLNRVERRIFSGQEKQMVFELSKISRELLSFKQAIDLHDDVIGSFGIASQKIFGSEFSYYQQAILGSYTRVNGAVEANTDILRELRETNNSLLSTKQNETMQILSIISIIVLPLTLLAGVFGMNAARMPFVNEPHGFETIVGIMVAITITMFAFFKYKKWL